MSNIQQPLNDPPSERITVILQSPPQSTFSIILKAMLVPILVGLSLWLVAFYFEGKTQARELASEMRRNEVAFKRDVLASFTATHGQKSMILLTILDRYYHVIDLQKRIDDDSEAPAVVSALDAELEKTYSEMTEMWIEYSKISIGLSTHSVVETVFTSPQLIEISREYQLSQKSLEAIFSSDANLTTKDEFEVLRSKWDSESDRLISLMTDEILSYRKQQP